MVTMMMTLVARLGVLGAGSGGQVQALAAGRQAVGGVSYRVAQLRCQRRCLSFGDAGAATVTAVEHGLVALKASTGMPWWAAICATAAVTRLAVLLPAAIKSEEHRSRIELLGPTLREWSDALRFKVYSKARREGQSQEAADHQLKKEMRAKTKELLDSHGLQRWKILGVGFAPVPAWLLMSLGVRQLCVAPSETSPLTQLLTTEGLPWCADLAAQDTTLVIPTLLCISNLVNVQLNYLLRPRSKLPPHLLHTQGRGTEQPQPNAASNAQPPVSVLTAGDPKFPVMLTSLALLMFPIYAALPSGLVLYWLVSSSSTIVQSIGLRHPRVRRRLSLPKVPSETSAPLTVAAANTRRDWRLFWREVWEKNFNGSNGQSK